MGHAGAGAGAAGRGQEVAPQELRFAHFVGRISTLQARARACPRPDAVRLTSAKEGRRGAVFSALHLQAGARAPASASGYAMAAVMVGGRRSSRRASAYISRTD